MKQALAAVALAAGVAMVACGGVDAPTSVDQQVTGVDDSSPAPAPVGADEKKNALEGQSEGDTGADGLHDVVATDPGVENPVEPGQEENAATFIFPNDSSVECTANLNLRSTASTSGNILRTMPEGSVVKVINGVASNGFIEVEHNGLQGFAAYRFLEAAATAGGGSGNAASSARDEAIEIAASGVGFSYWWGHGKWQSSGATSSNRGTCSGSCPSCTHGGAQNGADCSGYIAKIWKVPSSNTSIGTDTHPYSTADFFSGTGGGQWGNVSKSAMQKGDVLVYRSAGAGHMVVYDKGDAWGAPWIYEARGCSYGIVHNVRSLGSSFKGIKRTGW